MAAFLHAALSRRGLKRRGRGFKPMAEINVTPMVDVMLVLLIIFMVTAPLLTVGVPLELPETKGQQLTSNKEPLTISVQRDGKIYIQETQVKLDEIASRLKAIAYGRVAEVMAAVTAAGYKKVALVTEPEQKR